ncbi:D-alanyl-D-alanine carboxypeptidase [Candidatus Peregrinibacteria bacterium]|nr:D-alanyl-D-alanine carboxypeptidase [Candidatus Peregrinibacteria bacterium]
MLTSLFFALMAETVQPSYAAFSFIFPQNIVVEANASRTTVGAKKTVKKTESLEPVIRATSVFSVDLTNETPLLVRNIFERRPIASIGKLVTAMVILDAHALDETVTVTEHAANQEPTRMNLQAGEKITIENLLTGLLVGSANDAAIALAEYDAGSESAFVAKMNAKILSLGLHNTHFSNPPGFDEPANYSTAFDTMVFARASSQ